MADASTPDTNTDSSPAGSKGKKKGGLLTFIKKNKTLSAVVGGIGGYLLYKMSKEKSEGGGGSGEPEGEVTAIAGEGGAVAGTAEAAAFELGRAERLAEGSRSEVEEIEAEREEERRKHKEEIKAKEEEEEEEGREPVPVSPGSPAPPENDTPIETPGVENSPPSISIHGRNFPGATGSHIAKSGETDGGKKYVEYAIQFPGKVEHWQYFTATGNWRQVAGSDTGAGANKPGPGNNAKPNSPPPGGVGSGPKNNKPPKVGVGQNKPVSAPKPAPQPAPPRAPECAPGTVGNILHARNEINRLQGEINSLQASKPKGWAANVAGKQAARDQFQQVVANGRAQPGCGNV